MDNIRITAKLSSPIAVLDDWSPSLEAILEYVWLDDRGLVRATPNTDDLIYPEIPLQRSFINGVGYWCCSAPHYRYSLDNIDRRRKRWNGDLEGYPVYWGKGTKKIQTDGGSYKSGDLPIFTRNVDSIYWWAVGESEAVQQMLETVPSIGKHRGIGYGQILKWSVNLSSADYHLFGKSGQLMRPIPLDSIPDSIPHIARRWAWTTPFNVPGSKVMCAMPVNNVQKIDIDWFAAIDDLVGVKG